MGTTLLVILGDVNPHAIDTVEDRLAQWRVADNAAAEAEARVRKLGPGTIDVGLRDLALELREKADRLFASAVRAVALDEHESTRPTS